MIVVNLFGAPGVDRDAGAAYVFSVLKMKGVNADLVNYRCPNGRGQIQTGLLGRKHESLHMAEYHEYDVVITDSPLMTCAFYNESPIIEPEFSTLVRTLFDSFDNLNYFVSKDQPAPTSRMRMRDETETLSKQIKQKLSVARIPYASIRNNKEGYDRVISDVLNRIKNPPKRPKEDDDF